MTYPFFGPPYTQPPPAAAEWSRGGFSIDLLPELTIGIDSTKNQYGPFTPGTESDGWQELLDAVAATSYGAFVRAQAGLYVTNVPITYKSNNSLVLRGIRGTAEGGQVMQVDGTIIQPGESLAADSAMFKFTTETDSVNNEWLNIDGLEIQGVSVAVGSTIPTDYPSTYIGMQIGDGITGSQGGGAAQRRIANIKFDNCFKPMLTYNGGGPSYYHDLHATRCGNLTRTDPLFDITDIDVYMTNIETFRTSADRVVKFSVFDSSYQPNQAFLQRMVVLQPETGYALNGVVGCLIPDIKIDNVYVGAPLNGCGPLFNIEVGSSLSRLYGVNLTMSAYNYIIDNRGALGQVCHIELDNVRLTGGAYGLLNMESGASFTSLSRMRAFGIAGLSASMDTTYVANIVRYVVAQQQGYRITTPTVPASAGTYQNAFPYPIELRILTASGATATITDVYGNVSTSFALNAGDAIELGPGEIITPTYTTLTWQAKGL